MLNKATIENQIKDFFKELYLRKNPQDRNQMTDENWSDLFELTELMMGKSIKDMVDEVEVGIRNGHSIESQFNLFRAFITQREN